MLDSGIPLRNALSWFARRSWADVLYCAVVAVFVFATARIWWLSSIVPGMDYSQFLVFVRAVQDHGDPSSPFHGTYTTALWYMPTVLPIHLTGAICRVCGCSLEAAGKVLLAAQNVGLIAAGMLLLRELGRPRWAVVLLFPLVHSRWTVVGGYIAYATSIPLVLLGWALGVRWLRKLDVGSGVALAACLCATLLWHGIGFVVLGLGFAVLWLLWRAPSRRARLVSVLPTVPCLVQCAAWLAPTFGNRSGHGPPASWMTPPEAADGLVEFVWASIPHNQGLVLLLVGIVGAGLVVSKSNVGATEERTRMWRVKNPFLVVSIAYVVAYFLLPMSISHVEGMASRFAYPAVLAFVFAWNLPSNRAARATVIASVLLFAALCLHDLSQRFRAFQEDTRGASELIDRLGPHETLYYFPTDKGASKDFAPAHKPLRELQQYATIRHGSLPNSSFAGYGYNYVHYVGERNPMPGLTGAPSWSRDMTRFDYVLARADQGPSDARFPLVGESHGWELYGVCGSTRFAECP
jgi:hypothetical protein